MKHTKTHEIMPLKYLVSLLFLTLTTPLFAERVAIHMVNEGEVSKRGLHFTSFQFGPRITPHGDCVKVHGGYIFVTWYRGGMKDRHVMLSRKRIGGDTWHHIEFPHRHVMFRNDTSKGDSHNTIAVGISPKDDTIHLLSDMHAYTPSQFPDSYFNYSHSRAGAAVVSDVDWNIDLFYPKKIISPKNWCKLAPDITGRSHTPPFILLKKMTLWFDGESVDT